MEQGALLAMWETCMCAEVTVFRPDPHNDLASSGSVLSVTPPAASISRQTKENSSRCGGNHIGTVRIYHHNNS